MSICTHDLNVLSVDVEEGYDGDISLLVVDKSKPIVREISFDLNYSAIGSQGRMLFIQQKLCDLSDVSICSDFFQSKNCKLRII